MYPLWNVIEAMRFSCVVRLCICQLENVWGQSKGADFTNKGVVIFSSEIVHYKFLIGDEIFDIETR